MEENIKIVFGEAKVREARIKELAVGQQKRQISFLGDTYFAIASL